MLVAGKDIEACCAKTSTMAKLAGIHAIMATQRPSVDVITEQLNKPSTRISFQLQVKLTAEQFWVSELNNY